MTTVFEYSYLAFEPFVPLHIAQPRAHLGRLVQRFHLPRILDIGGRKSHYTIGVDADVVVIDKPRSSEIQTKLGLGVTRSIREVILSRRSNLVDYIVGDFLGYDFANATFDIVVAIEVIEHIREDDDFVRRAAEIAGDRGYFFLRTPNGEAIRNTNPDHYRHYTKDRLAELLERHFAHCSVGYAEVMGPLRRKGMGFWKPKRPLRMLTGIGANLLTRVENRFRVPTARNAARLYAIASNSSDTLPDLFA